MSTPRLGTTEHVRGRAAAIRPIAPFSFRSVPSVYHVMHWGLQCRVPYCVQVRVLYAFEGEAEGELTVAVGDSLWVETEVDGWYQVVRDGDGARGLVPTTYVDVEQF